MTTHRRLAAVAACLLAGVCLAAAAGPAEAPPTEIKDAYGPLGYEAPVARRPSRRLMGGLIAAGFCAAGFYWLVRRRRLKRRARAVRAPDAHLPDERLLALDAGEFYAHLTDLLRRALADAGRGGARALTPRELAARAPLTSPDAPGDPREATDGWREFCARAEAAEYAAAPVDEGRRRADAAFVADLLGRIRSHAARGGDGDAL